MKARDLDRKFDEGEDVTADLDLSKVRRPSQEQRRVRMGRDAQPSVGIVDSQSVKKPPGWEGNAATTAPRRSREQSAICWWIRRVSSSKPQGPRGKRHGPRRDQEAVLGACPRGVPARMRHPWLDAGYNAKGKGKDCVEREPWG